MPPEREPKQVPISLTGIFINLKDQAIEFQDDHGTIGRIIFAAEGTLVEGQPIVLSPRPQLPAEAVLPPEPLTSPAPSEQREKQQTTTLSGKLLTQPKEGKPDTRGKPTAWARFAAHIEGEDEAHLYSATFHRHTAAIALGLPKDASVTLEGYSHNRQGDGRKRMDTFSVIDVVAYPGKEPRSAPGRRTR